MSPERPLSEGAEVAGYTVGGVVGRGGTAVVYRATHPDRGDPVALKLIDPASFGPDAQALLERESRLASAVAHRHILPVYEAGRENDRPFVAMRLERCDLAAVLRDEGRLDPARAGRYVAQIGAALDAAHAHGLVHRDIKPSNVLLGEDDGTEQAYLTDFGVSRAAFSGRDAFGGDLVGTVGYLSPEQIRGEPLDGRTDVYALGCLLYECLVGRVPFRRSSSIATLWAHLQEEPTPPTALVPGLPDRLDAVVLRALRKEPHARFGSAGALAGAALEAVGAGRPTQARVQVSGAKLPTGSVTFLVADVGGFARRSDGLGYESCEAVQETLRVTCSAHGGVEADRNGEVLLFAFGTGQQALAAASATAEALGSGPTRVRVGVHTGTPHLTSTGYVGVDVERALEIVSCAHDGQVVVSGATAEHADASDTVSRGTGLAHLGAHRLTRFDGPVALFQLGEGSFPPLRTVATTNLPVPVSSFLGREQELREADLLLAETRLLTVTGLGGAGKTRFALELARRARAERFADYPDGIFACFFASLRDPALALPTVAQALSVLEQTGLSVLESLVSQLEEKRLLLLCDNLEHLPAAAPDLSELLEACPGLTLLCTSREPLRVEGEAAYALPPLVEEEGVALFCDRGRVEPGDTVRELCARLEGLPLAIELAAARLTLLSPEQLLARLSKRLDVLRAGKDADPRQQTLRATIQWSYDLLAVEEQQLLSRLSVFVGGCTLEAAEGVADADLDALQSLLEKSLLRRRDTDLGPRFSMLETIREFAEEALRGRGEADELAARHTAFFLSLGSEIASVRWGTSSIEDRGRFEADRANLLSVLSRATVAGDSATSLRLVHLVGDHLHTSTGYRESLRLARAALDLPGGDETDRAHALLHASRLAAELGRLDELRSYSDGAEAIFTLIDEAQGLWQVVQERAFYEGVHGNYAEAVARAERAVGIARTAGARELEMSATGVLAALTVEAELAHDRPDPAELRRAVQRHALVLEWARAEGSAAERQVATGNHAYILSLIGEHAAALGLAQEALRDSIRERDGLGKLSSIVLLIGHLAARLGFHETAARLVGFALLGLEQEGWPLQPSTEREQAEAEALMRATIGDHAYERGVREGAGLTQVEATELALSVEQPTWTSGERARQMIAPAQADSDLDHELRTAFPNTTDAI